jgi:hypothetical protein
VIVFCEPSLVAAVRAAIRPLFDLYGGVGFVSEAEPI